MVYRKISLELIVFADEAESVIAKLNSAVDDLEEAHTVFGGGIEMVTVDKIEIPNTSAIRHTLAAGSAALAAIKLAGDKVTDACKKVV